MLAYFCLFGGTTGVITIDGALLFRCLGVTRMRNTSADPGATKKSNLCYKLTSRPLRRVQISSSQLSLTIANIESMFSEERWKGMNRTSWKGSGLSRQSVELEGLSSAKKHMKKTAARRKTQAIAAQLHSALPRVPSIANR